MENRKDSQHQSIKPKKRIQITKISDAIESWLGSFRISFTFMPVDVYDENSLTFQLFIQFDAESSWSETESNYSRKGSKVQQLLYLLDALPFGPIAPPFTVSISF